VKVAKVEGLFGILKRIDIRDIGGFKMKNIPLEKS
jgi:hypothetical protein